MRDLGLALALLVCGCASDVTTRQAHRLVAQGAVLLDVRSRAEFAERHPAGALNVPVEELGRRTPELAARKRPIVVYCHTGVRSGIAVHLLRKAGVPQVYNLGSIGRWFREAQDPRLPLY